MGGKQYAAGLYLRLSKDDERNGESVSIENQRLLMIKYAEEQGWEIKDIYIDDGWSGTNQNRPGLQRLLADAKDKRINLVMVKDLSRLGRNHIEVGRLQHEIFPALGVRFVAVNDRVDSVNGEDDTAPFKNLFNEFLSRDTSRKVRAVKRACMERGKFLGTYAPLGYKKDSNDKHHLVIDEETAHIVRHIFEMRWEGKGFRAIACILNEEQIPSPKQIYYRRAGKNNPQKQNGAWSENTVKEILRNEVYIGNMVQGKTGSVSYKNHKLISKPEEEWVRVENTHEPLIGMDIWETIKTLDQKNFRPRRDANGSQSVFAGILKCADCGFNLRVNAARGTHKDGSPYHYVGFICGNYARSGKTACTVHTIYENVLTELVLHDIREKARLSVFDAECAANAVFKTKSRENLAYLATYRQELEAAEKRLAQLDNIVQTLYEDRVRGIITDSFFENLMRKYEREREGKTAAIKILREKVGKCAREWCDVDSWMNTIRKYTELESLSRDVLISLIDRIEVCEAERIGGRRICRIRIIYRFGDGAGAAQTDFSARDAYG